jgi:hypothetical protein
MLTLPGTLSDRSCNLRDDEGPPTEAWTDTGRTLRTKGSGHTCTDLVLFRNACTAREFRLVFVQGCNFFLATVYLYMYRDTFMLRFCSPKPSRLRKHHSPGNGIQYVGTGGQSVVAWVKWSLMYLVPPRSLEGILSAKSLDTTLYGCGCVQTCLVSRYEWVNNLIRKATVDRKWKICSGTWTWF